MEITEKEFAVINEISNNHNPGQRAIATRTGISLGMTNLIIKRLITRGYIKALALNRKKIKYILTQKGFSEKARKSYNFTLKTIDFFKSTKTKIQELVLYFYDKGFNEFAILGNNELSDISEMAFNAILSPHLNFTHQRIRLNGGGNASVIKMRSSVSGDEKEIDVMQYLSSPEGYIK